MFRATSNLTDVATNLTKAAVGLAFAPIAVAVDMVAIVTDSDGTEEEFHRTDTVLENIGDCVNKVLHLTND